MKTGLHSQFGSRQFSVGMQVRVGGYYFAVPSAAQPVGLHGDNQVISMVSIAVLCVSVMFLVEQQRHWQMTGVFTVFVCS